MWSTIWALALPPWILGHAIASESSAVGSPDESLTPHPQQVYQTEQTVFILTENTTSQPPDHRHLIEKTRLLQRLSPTHGRWNEHHPRHRLLEALRGFSSYTETNLAELNRLKGLYNHVPKHQKTLLEKAISYTTKFTSITNLIAENQNLCNGIVQNALTFYNISRAELDQHTKAMRDAGRPADRTSVSQALRHLVRDWAVEGSSERDAAFPCITKALERLIHHTQGDEPKALLPGAGLGRLGHEISKLGFEVTNNEWSMYQNVVYRFLEAGGGDMVYPFIDSWSHHGTTDNMLRGVSFPDTTLGNRGVALVEGDFTTVFGDETGHFDIVVTHFFIDTARNVMSYLETILRVLKPGGYWVNFGPLLYGSAPFVQFSLEEVIHVAEAMGFVFGDVPDGCGEASLPGKKAYGVEAAYGFDVRALTKNAYDAQFWVAKRP